MDDKERLDVVVEAVAYLNQRVKAQQYWLAQTYLLMSMRQPGRMAAEIRGKLKSLLNEPPLGPPELSPAELDALMVEEVPMMVQVGHEIAEHLEGLQRAVDEKHAREAAEAR